MWRWVLEVPIPGDESVAEGLGMGKKVLEGVDCAEFFAVWSSNTGCWGLMLAWSYIM